MKTILCYGDSNTWGSATRLGDDQRYVPAERWPGILQAELGSAWSVIAEGLPGRTSVHPDPIEGHWLDGSAYLHPCLRSHRPLDAVAIMLGTNDLKQRFHVNSGDIAGGIGVLLTIVGKSESGPLGGVPKMLVICPPPILKQHGELDRFVDMFAGGYDKSAQARSALRGGCTRARRGLPECGRIHSIEPLRRHPSGRRRAGGAWPGRGGQDSLARMVTPSGSGRR